MRPVALAISLLVVGTYQCAPTTRSSRIVHAVTPRIQLTPPTWLYAIPRTMSPAMRLMKLCHS